jgi:hypothetical protein
MNTLINASVSVAVLADEHSAPTTHIWSRIVGTVIMLGVIAGIYLLMWRGWKRRQARQSDIASPTLTPAETWDDEQDPGDGFEAVYVSTTTEGDWLDRITVHGMGNRSLASIAVRPQGILIDRASYGETDITIPADAVRGVRLVTGMAGKYLRDEGIVVITWQHGDRVLDTGVKPRYDGDRDDLVREAEAFAAPATSATERPAQ